MYFGAVDVEAAIHFLNGVRLAVAAFAGDNLTIWRQVIAERGWGAGAMHPSRPMLDRGFSPARVIDEMLVIEIETVRRLAQE